MNEFDFQRNLRGGGDSSQGVNYKTDSYLTANLYSAFQVIRALATSKSPKVTPPGIEPGLPG
jgi:hypothetical protein